MGGSVDTGSQTSQSASPAVRNLTDTLAKGVQSLYAPGKSSYVAPSATTTGAWGGSIDAANNPAFSGGIAGAIQSYGNRAAGNELGINDPLYAQQRARLTDDVMTEVNNSYNNSGLFGSSNNQEAAARGLAGALGGLDLAQRGESYGRQAEAAGMLPALLSSSLMPSSVQAGVGAEMDADARARAGGELDYMGQLMALLGGASNSAGTTTTEQMPWWKVGLGALTGIAGAK